MANLSKRNFNSNKKCYSVGAASFSGTDTETGRNELFNLPANSLVKSVALVVKEAGNSATATVRIGETTVISGASFATKGTRYANADSDATGTTNTSILTDGGALVTIQPSAALTGGEFCVIVEYIEYTKKSSELTNYAE